MVWVQSHPSLDCDACDQTKTHEGKILFCFDPLITFSIYSIIKYNSYQDTFFINRLKEMCILLVLRFKHHKGCDATPQKQRTSLLVNSHAFFSQQKPNLPQSKFFCICVCLSGDVMIPLNQTSNPASPQHPVTQLARRGVEIFCCCQNCLFSYDPLFSTGNGRVFWRCIWFQKYESITCCDIELWAHDSFSIGPEFLNVFFSYCEKYL